MRDMVRGRLLEASSYAIAGAIAVGAFGYCLFGACPTGLEAAKAAGASDDTQVESTAGADQEAGRGGEQAAKPVAGPGAPAGRPAAKAARVVAKDFEISGMFCAGCANHISAAVSKLPGVKNVNIDFESGKGTITYEEGKVDPEKLVDAIKKAGYKAKPAR